MSDPSYLVHFNKLHSSRNGRFINGDGDGDGIIDDHHNQVTAESLRSTVKIGKFGAKTIFSFTKLGKTLNPIKKEWDRVINWDEIMKGSNWKNYKAELEAKAYRRGADFINRIIGGS